MELLTVTEPLAKPGEINAEPFDRYTFGHLAAGVLLGLARVPAVPVIALAMGWEVVERSLKNRLPSWFPYSTQDTIENAVVDIAAVLVGWWVFRKWQGKTVLPGKA